MFDPMQMYCNVTTPYGLIAKPVHVLRRTTTGIRSTPKLKFVGLYILLRAGSQLHEDDDSRVSHRPRREVLVLGVLHEPARQPILVRLEARAPRGGAPTPSWELVHC